MQRPSIDPTPALLWVRLAATGMQAPPPCICHRCGCLQPQLHLDYVPVIPCRCNASDLVSWLIPAGGVCPSVAGSKPRWVQSALLSAGIFSYGIQEAATQYHFPASFGAGWSYLGCRKQAAPACLAGPAPNAGRPWWGRCALLHRCCRGPMHVLRARECRGAAARCGALQRGVDAQASEPEGARPLPRMRRGKTSEALAEWAKRAPCRRLER